MAQALTDYLGIHAGSKGQSGVGVAQPVECQMGQSLSLYQVVELFADPIRVIWRSIELGKDVSGIFPQLSEVQLVFHLCAPNLVEQIYSTRGK